MPEPDYSLAPILQAWIYDNKASYNPSAKAALKDSERVRMTTAIAVIFFQIDLTCLAWSPPFKCI